MLLTFPLAGKKTESAVTGTVYRQLPKTAGAVLGAVTKTKKCFSKKKKHLKKRSFSMFALRSYEKKNKDGFAAMTADELKFINGGAGCGKGIHGPEGSQPNVPGPKRKGK